MTDWDEPALIAFIVLGIIFACAIVGWDPRNFLPGQYPQNPQSGVDVHSSPGSSYVDLSLNESSINWGILDPGAYALRGLLIQNVGNASGRLSISSGNYTPAVAQQFINVSWNLGSAFLLEPGKNVAATLRLDISSQVHGVRDFTFQITITVTGSEN